MGTLWEIDGHLVSDDPDTALLECDWCPCVGVPECPYCSGAVPRYLIVDILGNCPWAGTYVHEYTGTTCFWTGLGGWVDLTLVGSDYILTALIYTTYYQLNLGASMPDCASWFEIVLPFLSDPYGYCVDAICKVTAVP